MIEKTECAITLFVSKPVTQREQSCICFQMEYKYVYIFVSHSNGSLCN